RLEEQKQHEAELQKQAATLIAERRQHALDRAIEAAFGGDLEKARKTILEAQQAGVEAHQVYWLNRLVQFQRGGMPARIREFRSSLALKPTVAAQAMLVRAYLHALVQSGGGNEAGNEYFQAFLVLRSMEPVTPEDYMCRGFALRPNEREQKMSDLNKAIAMRDSPIARTFRAHTACTIGLYESDLTLTESGLDDIRKAKFRLRDNPFVLFTSAYGHVNAAILYGKAGQLGNRKKALAEAKDDVDALEHIPITGCAHMRVVYYDEVGDEETALKILEGAVKQ